MVNIASSTDKDRTRTKLALIVASNLAFGLARMYEIYRSLSRHANKEIRVFKNEPDALAWIKEEI